MYFRVKRTGPYAYLQIVRSQREGGRVQQQVLTTLGLLNVLPGQRTTGPTDTIRPAPLPKGFASSMRTLPACAGYHPLGRRLRAKAFRMTNPISMMAGERSIEYPPIRTGFTDARMRTNTDS